MTYLLGKPIQARNRTIKNHLIILFSFARPEQSIKCRKRKRELNELNKAELFEIDNPSCL